MTFQLDTSGAVERPASYTGWGVERALMWTDLSPFAQGTLRAAAEELDRLLRADPGNYLDGGEAVSYIGPDAQYRFDAWSPEALALILKDCEAGRAMALIDRDAFGGAQFWRLRQLGSLAKHGFPPLTPYLDDEGKVALKVVA